MANYTGHILSIKIGWGKNWGYNWGSSYFSTIWEDSAAISGHPALCNDRVFVRPSWDHHWDLNWGGNVNLHDGWNVNWDKLWGGLYPGGYFRPKHEGFYPHDSSWGIDWNYNWNGGLALSGAYTNNRPIAMRGFSHTGHLAGGHAGVFYDRILIEPILLDFGTVLSEQTLSFIVWNGYLVPKQLDAINEVDFDTGTSFSGDTLPRSYYPLEEETYSVTVTTVGGPNIDSDLVFDWESPIPNITVEIIGSRIVLLPVTFRSGLKEYLVWKTDVLNSYNGTEQRVRVRLSPRQQIAGKAYLDPHEMHRVENLIYGWRKREWAIPMWIESRKIDSAVTAGDFTVNASTLYGDFRVDRLAVLWEGPRKYDVFQIASLTATTITANRAIAQDFSANAVLMPIRSARMMRDPVRSASGYDAVLEVLLEVTDNITLTTYASTTQWNGEDTYFIEPLTGDEDGVDDSYIHRIDTMDFGSGVVNWNAPWNNIRISRAFELVLDGLEEIWEHREWLHRRAGRLRPFYMPTFENNFKVLTEGNIADSFRAEKNDYSAQGSARNTICFKMTDGTYEIRTVTGATLNVSDELEVTFTPNLDRDASEVDEVNFFGLKRLSSDRLEIEWQPNNVAFTTVPITEISP